ncbi:helix-turn-helix domain-containing protein [Paraliomyxa miuraensis]|uniref:helix-turn-helix domain-containing protein n=1 Tax=Paraliomyxa miuraensis TaxID=376150 RepID=UPI00224FFB0F|nr:AraC family transcriptional regulator [Paraliomyxa miuraensis]MCX4241026.1 AraC family transcriptional regulator [Paraliomyxa miuraensis]
MSPPTRTMAALVQATVMFALSRGVTLLEVAQATGVSAEQLMTATSWLPQEVIPRIWLLLAERFPGEAVALSMASIGATSRIFGDLGRMGSLVPDLRSMILLTIRNRALLSDGLELQLLETDTEATLRMHHPMDEVDGGYEAELGLAMSARGFGHRFGTEGLLVRVEFRHRPLGPLDAYQRFFEVPVRFEQPNNALVLHAHALDRENPKADPALQLFVQRHLDRIREELGARADSPLLERVREAVAQGSVRGEFSVETLARRLGMSSRVLQRHLADEGTSPRALLDQARKAQALELVRDPRLALEEIACLLGYATERSFRRAFERWTGRTPAQARRSVGDGT